VQFIRSLLGNAPLKSIAVAAALVVATSGVARAEAWLVIEADSGRVLQADNATMPWYPASVTKIMTAFVTLKAVKEGRLTLEQTLTVSPVAASQSPSKMGFKPGTQVTVENALAMMMVKSANDMAVVLAEGVGGSIDGFSGMMNQAAKRLGMTQTNYVNPNGLPADGQVTSARDLAILARAVIRELPEYEYFMHIPAIRFGRRVTNNFNRLIGRYEGADGFKTGFICASGYNLVASATRNNRRLIAVVLGASSGSARAVRAAQLLERGFGGGNGLSWLRPSMGSVENLAPIDANPPNLRDEMCNGKRKRPASDDDDGGMTVAAGGSASAAGCDRRPASADAKSLRHAEHELSGRRADGRLYRPEEVRHRADRGRCNGFEPADHAPRQARARRRQARCGYRRGEAEGGGQARRKACRHSQAEGPACRRQAGGCSQARG
jgi:D-alanyl-D-alanine carboxypeptidase